MPASRRWGFLINLRSFASTLVQHFWLVFWIVGGLIGSKFLAAAATRRLFGYTRDEGLTMWSLSLPQVAHHPDRLRNEERGGRATDREPVLNSVIVLLVGSSVLGPVLTERYASRLPVPTVVGAPEGQPPS